MNELPSGTESQSSDPSELALAELLDTALGLARISRDLHFLSVNRAYAELVGRPVDKVVGSTLIEVLGETALLHIRPFIDRVLLGEKVEFETELAVGGKSRWIQATFNPFRDDNGNVAGWASSIIDVTDRLQMEESLLQRKEQLELLSDIIPGIIFYLDTDRRFRSVNQTFIDWFGRSREELIGYGAREFVGEGAWSIIAPYQDRAYAGENVDYEAELPYRFGGTRWIHAYYTPHRDAAGKVIGIVGLVIDVSHTKQSEQQLQASEMRYRSTYEHAPIGIAHIGLDGSWLRFNDAVSRITGYTAEELKNKKFEDITHPDDIEADWALARRVMTGEIATYSMEKRYIRKDGSVVWVNLTVSLLRDRDGKALNFISIIESIDARKRAEAELKEANRRKDEFIATLAHELRNPLAPVQNYLNVLNRTAIDASLKPVLGKIQRQVTHMVRLIDDLMDISRISRGNLELQKHIVSLASIINQSVETCQSFADRGKHQIIVSLPPQDVFIEADPIRLAQVLSNLINNACKYSDSGSPVVVSAEVKASELLIKIKDDGIGIAEDKLDGIFGIFSQVDSSIRRSQGGLGIGLSLVKRLIELHGGTVSAFSAGIGKGSEFTMKLPLPPITVQIAATKNTSEKLLKHRVLIVDDNLDGAESLCNLVSVMGYDVRLALSGAEAIQLAEAFRPQIILLDIGMPQMDGYETCRRIRELPWAKKICIIAQTGWGSESDKYQSRNAGFNAHLVKPIDINELLKVTCACRQLNPEVSAGMEPLTIDLLP